MRWVGHVARMGEMRDAYKILVGIWCRWALPVQLTKLLCRVKVTSQCEGKDRMEISIVSVRICDRNQNRLSKLCQQFFCRLCSCFTSMENKSCAKTFKLCWPILLILWSVFQSHLQISSYRYTAFLRYGFNTYHILYASLQNVLTANNSGKGISVK